MSSDLITVQELMGIAAQLEDLVQRLKQVSKFDGKNWRQCAEERLPLLEEIMWWADRLDVVIDKRLVDGGRHAAAKDYADLVTAQLEILAHHAQVRAQATAEAKKASKQTLHEMIREASKTKSGWLNTYHVTRQRVQKAALEMIGMGEIPPKQLLKANATEKIFLALEEARSTESGIVRVKRDWLNPKAPSDRTIRRARKA